MRTRIIGVPCATRRTHLHVDTVTGAEVANTPCDVDGGERDVLLYISKDVLTCNLMSIEGAACLQAVEAASIHHVERVGAREQPKKVIEGVGVTSVLACTPSRSGICSLPASLSTLKRVRRMRACPLALMLGCKVCACRRI